MGHPTTRNTNLEDCLDKIRPTFATVLPADAKSTIKLDLDVIDVIVLFQKKNYKVHLSVGTMSDIL